MRRVETFKSFINAQTFSNYKKIIIVIRIMVKLKRKLFILPSHFTLINLSDKASVNELKMKHEYG